MKKIIMLCSMVLVIGFVVNAEAISYSFDSGDGKGSAEMDITIVGSTLTLTLKNTTELDYGAPGITGFGFNLDPDNAILSWSLTAYNSSNILQTVGGLSVTGGDWVMDDTIAGVTLDYLPTTDHGIKGALYNPDAIGSSLLAATPNYFTTATLVLSFETRPILDSGALSTFVRMQNVGLDGKESLKLYGDPVPEPTTMLLFGTGIAGLAGIARRKRD